MLQTCTFEMALALAVAGALFDQMMFGDMLPQQSIQYGIRGTGKEHPKNDDSVSKRMRRRMYQGYRAHQGRAVRH